MRNNNSSNEIIFVSAVRKQNVLLIFTHFLIYICKMLQTPPPKKRHCLSVPLCDIVMVWVVSGFHTSVRQYA